MIRLRLFGRCRIYHDPVSPVLRAPAQIGWSAWFREIDLVTPRAKPAHEDQHRFRGARPFPVARELEDPHVGVGPRSSSQSFAYLRNT